MASIRCLFTKTFFLNDHSQYKGFYKALFSTSASTLPSGFKKLRGMDQIFPSEEVPESLDDLPGFSISHAMMTRQPTQDLVDALKLFKEDRQAYDEKIKSKCFLLTGSRGTGKTCGLAQAVHYARREGWLCLYVPNAYRLMHSAGYVEPSPHFPGMFTTDTACQEVLQQFLKAHELHLDDVPIIDPEVAERYSATKAPLKTMLDLVEFGTTDLDSASHVLTDLQHELAKTTVFPVLFAIDEYDTLFRETGFWFKSIKLNGEEFLTVNALREVGPGLQKPKELANGLCIAAPTCKYTVNSSWVPLERQFQSSIESGEIIVKEFKEYSDEEIQTCVEYYKSLNLENPNMPDDDELHKYIKVVTQSNPKLVSERFMTFV